MVYSTRENGICVEESDMPLTVKWIFFDLGSTLIDETAADTRRIKEMISGTDVTEEAYREKRLEMIRKGRNGDLSAIEYFTLTKTPWHNEDETPYPDAAPTLAPAICPSDTGKIRFPEPKNRPKSRLVTESVSMKVRRFFTDIASNILIFCYHTMKKLFCDNTEKNQPEARKQMTKRFLKCQKTLRHFCICFTWSYS